MIFMNEKYKKGIEVSPGTGIKKIMPISTSNTLFIGLTEKGSVNELRKISSFKEFQNLYGNIFEDYKLGYSVNGFFQNNGTNCYIIRVENIGIEEINNALNKIENRDINLIAIPDSKGSLEIAKEVIDFCEKNEHFFYIIDPPMGLTPNEIIDLKNSNELNSSFASIYYPNIYIEKPLLKDQVLVPPSGFIAGAYSRNDLNRGVWKAPAGRDVEIIGATRLEQDINNSEMEDLSFENINVIRILQNKILVWGAKTLEKDTDMEYIATKRLLIFIKQSILKGLQWCIFEPNNETLWAKIRSIIFEFLTKLWRNGALQGTIPEKAFYIVCDGSINRDDIIKEGKVLIELGIAALKPAEFIRFNIEIFAGKEHKGK
ncbi:MAG: hypothetical protein GF329_02120 [Candidatus Lokiarchaeota archaeon]|nr:hypothetical protein [Candidatus Lokiarchaeota archaeon]